MYRSPTTARVIRTVRLRLSDLVVKMEECKSAFQIPADKPKGKRPLGRPKLRWEENIKMNLKKVDVNVTNWVDSAQDRDYWRSLIMRLINHTISWLLVID